MAELYSYKGAYPQPLPKDMADYNIEDFTVAPAKPILTPGQKLEWNKTQWVVREPNEAELAIKWQEVRNERNRKLSETDIDIIRCYEEGVEVPISLISYRQNLRDIPDTQSNPFDIIWPTL
jgi:hypothetical protein